MTLQEREGGERDSRMPSASVLDQPMGSEERHDWPTVVWPADANVHHHKQHQHHQPSFNDSQNNYSLE